MELEKINNFIVQWISDYASKNCIEHLIVGVSGGIDSALTSTLCAMTNIATTVVSLPINQSKNELKNASKHMHWLSQNFKNITTTTIELSEMFKKYQTTIPKNYHSDLGFANTRSRIRMMILYQIASRHNGIVVGTGNKIEDFGIGFFTKYGDGGVDINPIADLTKSEVRKLSKFCGITPDIITSKPTDGLWDDGRTDEDQIGATYKELEWAMGFQNNTITTSREKKVLKIYKTLNKKNQHKMVPIPVCKIPKEMKI